MLNIDTNFKDKNLIGLSNLVLDAWPHIYKKFPGIYAQRFSIAYIKFCKLISDRKEFVFDDNKLIACIFCQRIKNKSLNKKIQLLFMVIKYISLWILGYFGKHKYFRGFIRANSNKNKTLVKDYHEESYEISLFLVNSKYRYKGIGKEILNRFIQHAKSNGAKELILSTDELSNWMFYEKTGFYRSSECFDPVSSYLDNSKRKIFVYKKSFD